MNNPAPRLVLLSGGLDSMVNLAEAACDGSDVEALFVDYGQIAAGRERQATHEQCDFYRVELETIELPWYRALLPQALRVARAIEITNDETVWAPNRNGLLVAIAAAFAEAKNTPEIIAGFNAEEAATFADNSLEFIAAYNKLLKFSTMNNVKLRSYTSQLDKKAIVKRALGLDAPLEKVYSCYSAGPQMCGKCVSCLRLKVALDTNGVIDDLNELFSE